MVQDAERKLADLAKGSTVAYDGIAKESDNECELANSVSFFTGNGVISESITK